MILGFMTKFSWGEPTNFWQKIIAGVYNPDNPQSSPGNMFRHSFEPKLHTIRASEKRRWKEGQTVQMATGVRTKFYNQFNKDIPELQTIKGVQRIDIFLRGPQACSIWIDEKLMFSRIVGICDSTQYEAWFQTFLQNDGITEEQFFKFFKKPLRNGQLIHWTDLKY